MLSVFKVFRGISGFKDLGDSLFFCTGVKYLQKSFPEWKNFPIFAPDLVCRG